MINRLIFTLILVSTIQLVNAQELHFISRVNISIGMDYKTLNYAGSEMLYSPGGGMGLEAGLQLDLQNGFALQSTIGYQLHLAFQGESGGGFSNKSSFNFNRKFLSLGALKNFKLSDGTGTLNGIHLGAGTHINLPGSLKRIENEFELGTSKYDPSLGFYVEIGLNLKIDEDMFFTPSIRYRQLSFSAKSFTEGSISNLPDYLQELNANGVELGVTFAMRLNPDKS